MSSARAPINLQDYSPTLARIVVSCSIIGMSLLFFALWRPFMVWFGSSNGGALNNSYWYPRLVREVHFPICTFLFLAATYAAFLLLELPNSPVDIAGITSHGIFYLALMVVLWAFVSLLDVVRDAFEKNEGEGVSNGVLITEYKRATKLKLSGDYQKDVEWKTSEPINADLYQPIHTGYILPMISVTKWLAVSFVFLMVFGFNTTACFIALLVAFSVGVFSVSAGSQWTGNFSGLITLVYDDPFHVGDVIEVAGVTGYVQEVRYRCTVLRLFDMTEVFVPNFMLTNTSIVNCTRTPRKLIDLSFTCSQHTTVEVVEQLKSALDMIIRIHDGVDYRQYHKIWLSSLSHGFTISLRCYTRPFRSRSATIDDIIFRLLQISREYGVVLQTNAATVIPCEIVPQLPRREPPASSVANGTNTRASQANGANTRTSQSQAPTNTRASTASQQQGDTRASGASQQAGTPRGSNASQPGDTRASQQQRSFPEAQNLRASQQQDTRSSVGSASSRSDALSNRNTTSSLRNGAVQQDESVTLFGVNGVMSSEELEALAAAEERAIACLPPAVASAELAFKRCVLHVELKDLRAKVASKDTDRELYVVLLAGSQQWSSAAFRQVSSLREMHFAFDVSQYTVKHCPLSFEVYSMAKGLDVDSLLGWTSQSMADLRVGNKVSTRTLQLSSPIDSVLPEDQEAGHVTLSLWLAARVETESNFCFVQVEVRDPKTAIAKHKAVQENRAKYM